MYVNNIATTVERNTSFPINFTLPKNILGKTSSWKITLVNKSDSSIKVLSGFTVKEIGEFVNRGAIQGDYQSGAMTIKVDDSSLLAVGQVIRILNTTYTIMDINSASHLLTLDNQLSQYVPNLTPIQLVTYPELLGMYTVEDVKIESVGNYLVVISDKDNEVKNIVKEVVVVVSLQTISTVDKISPIQDSLG